MTALDQEIDRLRQERADMVTKLDDLAGRIDIIEAEIRGMTRARDLFVPPTTESAPQRRAAQKPIMDLFESTQVWWDEAKIVEQTGLPLESVHRFLLRAVQSGKLQQRVIGPGEPIGYELPPSHTGAQEAAE